MRWDTPFCGYHLNWCFCEADTQPFMNLSLDICLYFFYLALSLNLCCNRCWIIIVCFFDAESKQNCSSTPMNFTKFALWIIHVWPLFIKTKKKNWKRKEWKKKTIKKRTLGVFHFWISSSACCVLTQLFLFLLQKHPAEYPPILKPRLNLD